MTPARIITTIAAAALVLITLPVFLTISGLSLMAFDTPPESAWPFVFAGSVIAVSVIVPVGSLVGSLILIHKKNRLPLGLALSLIPLVVLGIFWTWLSQQSFT